MRLNGIVEINETEKLNASIDAVFKVNLAVLLNEAATHTIKLYDPANMLINETCYKLTTAIILTPCNN